MEKTWGSRSATSRTWPTLPAPQSRSSSRSSRASPLPVAPLRSNRWLPCAQSSSNPPDSGKGGRSPLGDLQFLSFLIVSYRWVCIVREQTEHCWCPIPPDRVDYVLVLPRGRLLDAGAACCRTVASICNDHYKARSLRRRAQHSHASAA